MSEINWQQKRNVYRNTETEELFVEVPGGMLELDDYTDEGGFATHRSLCEPLVLVGQFTNAQMSNGLDI